MSWLRSITTTPSPELLPTSRLQFCFALLQTMKCCPNWLRPRTNMPERNDQQGECAGRENTWQSAMITSTSHNVAEPRAYAGGGRENLGLALAAVAVQAC